MLYTVGSVVRVVSCFAFLVISHAIISEIEGNKNHPLKMGVIGTRKLEEQLLG